MTEQRHCNDCGQLIDHNDPYQYCLSCRDMYGRKKRIERLHRFMSLPIDELDIYAGMSEWKVLVEYIKRRDGNTRQVFTEMYKWMYNKIHRAPQRQRQTKTINKKQMCEVITTTQTRKTRQKYTTSVASLLEILDPMRYSQLVRAFIKHCEPLSSKRPSNRTAERYIKRAIKTGEIYKDDKGFYRPKTSV